MTSDDTTKDDAVRTAMRAYADNLQPPAVADVMGRAERTQDTSDSLGNVRQRRRRPLVFAAAAVAIAVIAVGSNQMLDGGTADVPAVTQPAASTGPAAAPGCPPALPLLDEPLDVEGKALKPIMAAAGEQLTVTARIRPSDLDRRLLSFALYLLPPGADMNELARAVAQSAIVPLTPDQQSASPVLQIPAELPPGTYDLVGAATYPGPSLCGVKNPADSTQIGTTRGVLVSVVIK